jgi:hypothetical protein
MESKDQFFQDFCHNSWPPSDPIMPHPNPDRKPKKRKATAARLTVTFPFLMPLSLHEHSGFYSSKIADKLEKSLQPVQIIGS